MTGQIAAQKSRDEHQSLRNIRSSFGQNFPLTISVNLNLFSKKQNAKALETPAF